MATSVTNLLQKSLHPTPQQPGPMHTVFKHSSKSYAGSCVKCGGANTTNLTDGKTTIQHFLQVRGYLAYTSTH